MNIESIILNCSDIINNCTSVHLLQHDVKPKVLGKDSIINEMSSKIASASIEEKKELGKNINILKTQVTEIFNKKLEELELEEIEKKLSLEGVDYSIDSKDANIGKLHPITKTIFEIKNILQQLGFSYKTGYEIESDDNNFTMLNIGEDHPARQMHDTFYINSTKKLLRTHTTSVDIREIIKNGVPISIMSCGKTFRNDHDATHSPMFHQFEGLMIDKGLNMQNLKYCLEFLLKKFFNLQEEPVIRLRPSFFPFTEPSCEVDIGYEIKNDKITIGGSEKFLEILGCGMLHPNVLKNCGVDPNEYSGIAFGGGVERLAMLKYGIKDLRYFFDSDHKWLSTFGFNM